MSIRNALPIAAFCALSLLACGSDNNDSEPNDAATKKDSGASNDSGAKDAGATDSGNSTIDSGKPDASAVKDSGATTDAGGGTGGETATIAPFGADAGAGGITGTAKFTLSGGKVTVVVTLNNCPDGVHPVHIHQGTSCADVMMQGGHWGTNGVRGEGITSVTCSGMTGMVSYTNEFTATSGDAGTRADAGTHTDAGADAAVPVDPSERVWTLDGNSTTDPKGHAFVVHASPTDTTRIGCGIIN